MTNYTHTLTDEKFQDIYTDEKFRNQVAFAHGCYTADKKFKHLKTCSYPVDYIVTEEQKNTAEIERQRAKNEAKENLGNKLVLVGMGSEYASRYEGDICNYRVRTYFLNKFGTKCFIEVGTGRNPVEMRVDHAIFKVDSDDKKNNYQGLERRDNYPKYTLENLLNFVNSNFDCNFSEIEIDQHTLSPDEFICVSPK